MKRRYDKYRESGVEWIGEIPEGWSTVRAKYYFSNFAIKGKIDEPLLSVTQKNSLVRRDELENRVWNPESDISGYKLVESGDFVISLRTFEGGIELSEIRGLVSPAYTVLRRIKEFSDKFMKYLFKSEKFINELNKITTGIRQGKNISFDDFSNILIPIPSLNIQVKIGSYLDHKTALIDKLISITERKIELLKEKRTTLINHAVTKGLDPNVRMKDSGIEWIGEIPEHWEVKRLKHFCNIIYGISPEESTYNIDGIGSCLINGPAEYSVADFGRTRELKWTISPIKFAPKDSLLFCLRGSTTGRMNIAHKEVAIGRGVCSIESHESQEFLTFSLLIVRRWIQNQLTGSTFPAVTKEDVDNFIICSPPEAEQELIIKYLSDKISIIDTQSECEKKRITALKQYRQTLISDVVTGKINVEDEV